ncbi:MAG: hypothetical protein KF712_06450 [Akkermansiaceae bacterium]|nr:hypothetical protein [Akkermansiaceae bacterium]
MSGEEEDAWPPPFYFNGVRMPKWSACWHLCNFGDLTKGYRDKWDEFIGLKHLWHLECRMGHEDVVESEDADIFRVCAQEALRLLVNFRELVVSNIEISIDEAPPETVFQDLLEGTAAMIGLCSRDGIVFWTSGGPEALATLEDTMRDCAPPVMDPERAAPHHRQRRSELGRRMEVQLADLRKLAESGLPKRVRKLLLELPGVGK